MPEVPPGRTRRRAHACVRKRSDRDANSWNRSSCFSVSDRPVLLVHRLQAAHPAPDASGDIERTSKNWSSGRRTNDCAASGTHSTPEVESPAGAGLRRYADERTRTSTELPPHGPEPGQGGSATPCQPVFAGFPCSELCSVSLRLGPKLGARLFA